jgi:tetratricopeptide (TPR) repeat protein
MPASQWFHSLSSRIKSSPRYVEFKSWLERETTIAFLMALVAMLGMVTAYRTATAEEDASLRESKLTQSRFLELTKREELLARMSDSGRFELAKSEHMRRAQENLERAAKIRSSDRGRAALLELQAEEEFTLARLQEPYLSFTEIPGVGNKKLSINQIIDRQVADALAASGLGSKWEETGSTIWESLESQIGQSRSKLKRLALDVVIFVVALGFLSLAELWRHKQSLRLKTMAVGIGVSLWALFFAIRTDHTSGWYFLGCCLGFAVLWPVSMKTRQPLKQLSQSLATRLGFMTKEEATEEEESEGLHPPETELRMFAGARMHMEHPKSAFTCFVVLLIVLAVLLSAWVGYCYSGASIEASRSAGNAIENLTNGLKNSHTLSAYFELGMFAAVQERRARYQAAVQQNDLARNPQFGIDRRDADEILYRASQDVTPRNDTDKSDFDMVDGNSGPEHDRRYPQQWVLGITLFGPECGFALSDAANEQSLRWHDKAHWYLAGITMFAIALYLFGQSLSMARNDEAWTLVFYGLIVLGVGIGLATTEGLKRIPRAEYKAEACSDKNAKSDDPGLRASVDYAYGVSDFQVHDYKSAVEELETAVKARPNFLFANLYLSLAAKDLGNPQEGEGFLNMIPEGRISEAVEHEKKALEGFAKNGLEESPVLLGNYGFDTYLYGLVKKDREMVKRGLQRTRDAIKHDPKGQFLYLKFNEAIAELALGNMSQGLAIISKTAKKDGMKGAGDQVAATVGDLEAVYHYCEGLNSQDYCRQIQSKEAAVTLELAAAAWPPPSGAKEGEKRLSLRHITVQVIPSGLRWEAEPVNFSPDDGRATLAVLWYTKAPGGKVWRVLSRVSGKVEPKEVSTDEGGKIHQFQSYLEATDQEACLPAGDYRADVYLNGSPFYVTTEPLDAPTAMRASPFWDMNLSLCRPNGWKRWRQPSLNDAVVVGGYLDDKDHPKQGVFVFNFYYPKTMWDPSRAKDLVSRAHAYLASQKFMTAGEFVDEQNSCTVDLKEQAMIRQVSKATGERLVARVWPAKEGIVHVVVAYTKATDSAEPKSPDPLGEDGSECNSLRSVREVFDIVP